MKLANEKVQEECREIEKKQRLSEKDLKREVKARENLLAENAKLVLEVERLQDASSRQGERSRNLQADLAVVERDKSFLESELVACQKSNAGLVAEASEWRDKARSHELSALTIQARLQQSVESTTSEMRESIADLERRVHRAETEANQARQDGDLAAARCIELEESLFQANETILQLKKELDEESVLSNAAAEAAETDRSAELQTYLEDPKSARQRDTVWTDKENQTDPVQSVHAVDKEAELDRELLLVNESFDLTRGKESTILFDIVIEALPKIC